MVNNVTLKVAMVAGILGSAALGAPMMSARPGALPIGTVWVVAIVAFGLFNALVSPIGTAWVRVPAVLGTMATLLWGRIELFTLGVWIAWPPAYVVSWALSREAERRTAAVPEAKSERFTPARINLAALIIALTIASIVYRLLFARGLQQSAALFIGIPALIAVLVVFTVSPKSAQGIACKAVTVGLLISMLFLGEGMICVIMAAPLFYAVAVGIATSVQWAVLDHDKRLTLRSVLILLPLVPMSLEGVTPATSFNRQETVVISRTLDVASDNVARAVFEYPRFDRPLPAFFRAGFPTPVAMNIDMTAATPRWVITFRGGEMRLDGVEPRVGALVLELVQSGNGFARWRALSDSSHMTHYLGWREMTMTWEPSAAGRTHVTCAITYSRDLDPAWYFGPWERYAMRLAAGYLIETVATP
jgi:hypothetical protein